MPPAITGILITIGSGSGSGSSSSNVAAAFADGFPSAEQIDHGCFTRWCCMVLA
jgi:hypothetical protein